MSIYTKPIIEITPADLQELLDEKAVENVRLEFKLEIPDKDETLKKLSSFANTFGGYVVIGAKANSKDGLLTALPGVDTSPNYKQKIVQWCYDAVSPPLEPFVSNPIPAPGDASKVCYIIYIPESEEAPHFLNGRKGVYIRTDEFSQRFAAHLATYDEIQHLAHRRAATVERKERLIKRAEERFDAFVAIGDTTNPNAGGTLGATLKLALSPRFPSRSLLSQGQLLSLIQDKRVYPWRGTTFPLSSKAALSQHESALVLDGGRGRFSLLEANIWGLLFYACEIEHPSNTERGGMQGTIHLHDFIGRLLVFLEHARQSYAVMGYEGTLEISMVLERMRGKPFIHFPEGFAMKGPESYLDDNIRFTLSTPSSRLQTSRDAVAVDILRTLLFAVNFPEMAMEDTHINRLLDHGYKFNSWTPPTQ